MSIEKHDITLVMLLPDGRTVSSTVYEAFAGLGLEIRQVLSRKDPTVKPPPGRCCVRFTCQVPAASLEAVLRHPDVVKKVDEPAPDADGRC